MVAWPAPDPVTVETVDDAGLAALTPEWTALWRDLGEPSPFASPAWTLAWAGTHAPGRTRAVVVRRDGRLVALAPAFVWEGTLLAAGTGPSDEASTLTHAAHAPEVLAGLVGLARSLGATRVDLRQLHPTDPLVGAPAPRGLDSRTEPDESCPAAPITGEAGLGAMPGKWRRKLGYTRRRSEAPGGCVIERLTGNAVAGGHADLQRLHAKRWRAEGEPGVLGEPLQRALLERALPALDAAGGLRLYRLLHAGEVAAVLCAFASGKRLCFYACGVDPDRAELGAGTLLIAHAIEAAAAEGLTLADFLRGEERYKAHWGATPRPRVRRVVTV